MAMIDSYLNLITSEHRDKPKYMAMVTALLQHSDDIFALGITIDDEFDVMLATGAQEDILGILTGVSRVLDFQPQKGISPVLDNAAFRTLIRAAIAKNMWKGGIMDLKEIWDVLFGDGIMVQDNQNMTIDVTVVGDSYDQISKNMIKNGYIVPKPQSVRMDTYFSEGPIFGYDMETKVIRGYDEARWMNPIGKDSFSYDTEDKKEKMFGYDEGNWT